MKLSSELHPLVHIFLCLFISSVAFVLSSPLKLLALSLFAFVYACLRLKQGISGALKTLLHSLPLLLSIFIVQLIFRRQGEVLWQWGFWTIHSTGYIMAIRLILRLLCVIYGAKVLASLSFQDFSLAFALLNLPEELSFMLSYGVHLVPQFLAQLKGFVTRLKLRGVALGRLTFRQRLQVFRLLAIAALASIIKGSETRAIALELRGFRSSGKRSFLHFRRISLFDLVFALPLTAMIIFIALA